MGNEDVGQSELILKSFHEVDGLGLDGNIKGRNWFVTDKHFGAQGDAAGDADALSLTARELVGVSVDVLGVEANHVEQFSYGGFFAFFRGGGGVDVEGLADDVADGFTWVE